MSGVWGVGCIGFGVEGVDVRTFQQGPGRTAGWGVRRCFREVRCRNTNLNVHRQPDASTTHLSKVEEEQAWRKRESCWVWGRGSGFKRILSTGD